MDALILKKLNELKQSRKAAIVLTNLNDGTSSIVEEHEQPDNELDASVTKAFQTGKSVAVEQNGTEYFLNVHLPPPRLIVIGAVHISQALAPMANISGYHMEVIDPRTAFATPERFETVDLHADWPEDVLKNNPLDAYCALAAVTHDPKIDDYPLIHALEAGCFYIGALGSRKTHAKRIDRLTENGVSEEQIKRIHSPIGLDIGASSPQEIAVAIMGEVIQAFRTRSN